MKLPPDSLEARIVIEWGSHDSRTTVEWTFTPRPDRTTFVGDEVVKQALDATGGFTLVLAGAEAFLEHDIVLNLIADRYPDGH